MGIDIFAGSDPNVNDEDLSKIEINKDFARRFEHNKKREELQRYEELKKKGLAASSDDSSDEGDDEDDDDELLEPDKDLKFYDALVRVKKQDPVLIQKDAKLFDSSDDDEEESERSGTLKKRKAKPMYLKDVNYKYLTEEGPELREEKSERNPNIYNRDQEENIKAFIEAEKEAFASDDDGDILKEKESKGNEMDEVENENAAEIQKRLDEYFGEDGNLNEDDMFLKKYLLDKMWVNKEKEEKPVFDDIGVSEDEDELDKQDKYEAEYNFRHEEAEGDRILGHARFTEGSVRKKTSSRKVQRKSKEERMAQAEFERKEDLKHLKNLKKKEIKEKLEKVRAIAGIGEDEECKLGADDLEEDFDPEEYDKKMRQMFGEDYYGVEDVDPEFGRGDEGDIEKPDFDKEDELLGLPKDWDVCGSNDGFKAARERMLKQGEKVGKEEEPQEKEGKKKRKRKITLKEKVELDKELEEYYKLDYEDTIGDLKTRFKYKPVPANKFGLGTEEILMADDTNLNQYVSLKKIAPYREKEWKVTYHQKLKKGLIIHGEKSDDGSKNSKNHGSKVETNAAGMENKGEESEESDANVVSRRMKRRRRQAELKLSRSRLMAYGKIPSKPQKNKMKKTTS